MKKFEGQMLNLEGEQFDIQLQNFWKDKLERHLHGQEFSNANEIREFIQDEFFSNGTYYRDARNLRMDRKGDIENLRTVKIQGVNVPFVMNGSIKNARIEMEILFRLIVPEDYRVTIGNERFVSDLPHLEKDSYVGNIDIEIN